MACVRSLAVAAQYLHYASGSGTLVYVTMFSAMLANALASYGSLRLRFSFLNDATHVLHVPWRYPAALFSA